MRKVILFLALIFASSAVSAATFTDYLCLPKTASTQLAVVVTPIPPFKLGSNLVQVETPAAQAEAWWCLEPSSVTTPPGKITYRPQYRWNLKKYANHPDLASVFRRIMAAPDLLEAVNGEMRVASLSVTEGTQDAYQRDLVLYTACQALAKPPYLVPIDPLPANWCGTAPVQPGVLPDVYKTPAAGTYTLYTVANGKLASIIAGRKATANATCNSSVPAVMSGTSIYLPLAGGPLTEYTLCKKVTQ